ncbi:hypothetical protein GON03_13595 [Nocardioides sp. MAH-18]|uniref:Uncharacterized protein n=1 Tax=Nocardioides agri TaxID=2682843 RepID=A0A6L6XUQ2_9ACTN|nr:MULTISPECIES: hypothetical protein [unclassified Nocardioides]MBA2955365.1 hypothetical protein [Nocardioides sp. CGMCC 1.13656]MVQ50216.1 hypothetical protein [Nocardioides sp. MAH-18]
MPDEEPREEQPSLELPSLGGWRRRRRSRAAQPVAEPTDGERSTSAPTETVEDPRPAPVPAEPVAAERPGGAQPTVVLAETVEDPPPAPAKRIRVSVRRPAGYAAVLGAGALVGLLMVGLTWGSLRTCEQVQGTSSCGRAGYPMLLFVLVVAVVVGAMLLRLCLVPDPVGTSFLGTGLTTVLALLFLVDQLDQPAMVVVVPVLAAACFAAAHWVTTTFVEPGDRTR